MGENVIDAGGLQIDQQAVETQVLVIQLGKIAVAL